MYGGLATPSEIAGVSAFLALALVMAIYKNYKLADLWLIFRDTVRESSMILMIIAAAAIFSYMMSLLYVTQSSAEWLVGLSINKWVLMLVINLFLLVLGCFLPPVAIILMVMPILTPVLDANNFDLIWFAVMLTINLEVGLITPPVGPEPLCSARRCAGHSAYHDPARLDAVRVHHAGVHGGAFASCLESPRGCRIYLMGPGR